MKWRNYPQNIKVRLLTSFLNRALTSAVLPFMALFFAEHKGAIWSGVFLGMTVLVGFVGNLIGGYLSDRFRRKIVLTITSTLSAGMFGLMTVSLIPEEKWIWLFACSYVVYIATSSMGRPAMQAIIVDSTTNENRIEIYAIDYWLVNLSMAIGTALGGLFYATNQYSYLLF